MLRTLDASCRPGRSCAVGGIQAAQQPGACITEVHGAEWSPPGSTDFVCLVDATLSSSSLPLKLMTAFQRHPEGL